METLHEALLSVGLAEPNPKAGLVLLSKLLVENKLELQVGPGHVLECFFSPVFVSILSVKPLEMFPVAYVCVALYPWLQVACSVIAESAIK